MGRGVWPGSCFWLRGHSFLRKESRSTLEENRCLGPSGGKFQFRNRKSFGGLERRHCNRVSPCGKFKRIQGCSTLSCFQAYIWVLASSSKVMFSYVAGFPLIIDRARTCIREFQIHVVLWYASRKEATPVRVPGTRIALQRYRTVPTSTLFPLFISGMLMFLAVFDMTAKLCQMFSW